MGGRAAELYISVHGISSRTAEQKQREKEILLSHTGKAYGLCEEGEVPAAIADLAATRPPPWLVDLPLLSEEGRRRWWVEEEEK